MNFRSTFSSLVLALAATAVFALPSSLHAGEPPPISLDDLPVLLTIDLSDLNQVTFTSTGENSWASDSGHDFNLGLTLVDFFSSPQNGSTALGDQTLYPVGNGSVYNYDSYYILDFINISNRTSLNLYKDGDYTDYQSFTQGSPALTGMASINLNAFAASLPGAGQKGYLYAGSTSDNATLIGAWAVVPESSTTTFLFISAALLLLLSRVKGVTPSAAA